MEASIRRATADALLKAAVEDPAASLAVSRPMRQAAADDDDTFAVEMVIHAPHPKLPADAPILAVPWTKGEAFSRCPLSGQKRTYPINSRDVRFYPQKRT